MSQKEELQEKKLALDLAIKAKKYIKKEDVEALVKKAYNDLCKEIPFISFTSAYEVADLYKEQLIKLLR